MLIYITHYYVKLQYNKLETGLYNYYLGLLIHMSKCAARGSCIHILTHNCHTKNDHRPAHTEV